MNTLLSFDTILRKVIQTVCVAFLISFIFSLALVHKTLASAPEPGGDTTVINPSNEEAVSITEDAVQPESANIRLIVPNLVDPAGGTPGSIRIISVTGGTLWQSGGSTITLGASGTILSLSSSRVDLRFRPDAGRDTDAIFQYVVVDPHDSSVNSTASTATIPITAVNDDPVLQTASGSTGIGLAATYYTQSWDLTGTTYKRIDPTVDFSDNFNVSEMNNENFSVRWTGQVKSPISGEVTFSTASDDGVRLWIDDDLIIDNWTVHGTTIDTASPVTLEAGTLYNIRMEFYERGGGEVAQLRWAYSGQGTQIIPQEYLFPAITRPTLSYVNGSASVVIDDAVTVSDVDSSNLVSAKVVISDNFQSDEDSLIFSDQNSITGSYSDGTLILSGTASLADYQAALRSVRYANSNSDPDTSTRTIEFTVNDGEADSNSTYRNIEFTGTNNPPAITEGDSVSVTMDEDGSPTAFSLTLNATDADHHSVSWSISSEASHGMASVSGSGDSKDISYMPHADYNGSDSFAVQVSDGAGGTDTITVNVTISPRNDAPYIVSNPKITGTGYVGDSLATDSGVWSDSTDITPGTLTYAYQWQVSLAADGSDSTDIIGSTNEAYIVTPDQVGKYVGVKVTATDDGEGSPSGQSVSAYSTYVLITHRPSGGSKKSSSGGDVDIPDPVKSATVAGQDINRDPSTIEAKLDKAFIFRIKASDYDQVKSVALSINGKKIPLIFDGSAEGNPVFSTNLSINNYGTYPYTVIVDYGTTTRSRKGVIMIKDITPEIPEPVVAVSGQPGSFFLSSSLVDPVSVTIDNQDSEDSQPFIESEVVPVVTQANPQPIANIPPSASASKKSPGVFARIIGALQATVQTGMRGINRTGSHITQTALAMVKGITWQTSNLMARAKNITNPFGKNENAHMYQKVTIKLASTEGVPLAGAKVTLFSTPREGVTDSEGRVEFTQVEGGRHTVAVDYDGYTTKQPLLLDQQIAEVTINITAEFKKK